MTQSNEGLALMAESDAVAPIVETASAAVAAQAAAMVQARCVMALKRPRKLDQVRAEVLKECKRPAFAEAALYDKPIGKTTIRGLSIRFAEAAARSMGNLQSVAVTMFDDDNRRIVNVIAIDLETNVSYERPIMLQKVVERRSPRPGQTVLSRRTNSVGEITFLVAASEDELAVKEAAQVSKVLRTLLLRLVPGDLQEEARALCEATVADKSAKDPDGEKKRILDAFAGIRVMPADLAALLGHDLNLLAPKEIVELRGIFQTIRDGETTWQDVIAARTGAAASEAGPKPSSLAGLTNKLKAESAQGAAVPPHASPADLQPAIPAPSSAVSRSAGPGPDAARPSTQLPEVPVASPAPTPAPKTLLDEFNEVIDEARMDLPGDAFSTILRLHGAKRGDPGMSLGTDGQRGLMNALRDCMARSRMKTP